MITSQEIGSFLKLFIRDGYVLNFSDSTFDVFTQECIGVAIKTKYCKSKGRSLSQYAQDASNEDIQKLLFDMLNYYENEYPYFENETQNYESPFNITADVPKYLNLYKQCSKIRNSCIDLDSNSERLKHTDIGFSSEYMKQQINMMLASQSNNPTESIGKAKELIESCCRTILSEVANYDKKWTLSQLVTETMKQIKLMPRDVSDDVPCAKSIKSILGSLKGMVSDIADLRNEYGAGHGKVVNYKGLEARHARLLVGASITLVDFLWSSYINKETDNL